MDDTAMSISKMLLSSSVAKPYSRMASSRTYRLVRSVTLSPTPGST